jgi:2-keto-3-deoxy-L-rhamnonate aldolase RhmA
MTRPAISFLERLTDKKPLIGTLVSTSSTEVAEVLSFCGFEWLFIDGEHSVADMAAAQRIVQTISTKTYSLVRLPDNSPQHFKKALDIGCDGVIVPMIRSVAEAENAVRAAKYPPLGERSVGMGRAQAYGLQLGDYVKSANARIALVLQVEHKDAVEQVEKIVTVPGVDAILIGPYDLSASMGRMGEISAPEVAHAIQRVRRACLEAKIPYGAFCATSAQAKDEITRGGRLIALGTDLLFMAASAKEGLATLA